MGVAPVDGYGNITSGNAKEIYTKYKKGEVNLTPAQQKYCENFLTPEEIDEVSYDTDVKNKEGKDKIGDAKKADEHGGQGGNAVGTTAANIATIVGFCALLPALEGFSTLAFSAVCLGVGLLQSIIAKAFDAGYNDRTKANDNADGTNATIDGYTNALLDTMDMMNEDMDLYQKQSEEYTLTVNTNTSQMASLQVDLAAAQAAGDKAGVESIKNQMKQIEGMDLSGQTDEMDETKGRLDEYNAANSESQGVSSAGQSVSDFLKEGTALGIVAGLNAAIDTVAAIVIFSGFAATSPKLPFGIDIPACIAGKIMGGVAGAAFMAGGAVWASKAKKEFECGSSGRDMEGHVGSLNDMIEQQAGYVESTTETFDAADEASTESQGEAKEKANKAVQTKGALPTTPKKDDEDGDKDGGGSPAPAGAAA